jgi:hypothetical protein
VKTLLLISGLVLVGLEALPQDTANNKEWKLSGYIKVMETGIFHKDFRNPVTGNLIHNRINVKWQPDSQFMAVLEIRNRLFWGDEVRRIPNFTGFLRNTNENVNASALWISKSNFILHSQVDRFLVEWHRPRWNIRVGRQRINWDITGIWNPNDLFNPYSFLDFDYEERPGSDAAKIQYLFNDASHLEIAWIPSDEKNKTIAAARYFITKWGYDLQIISGMYQNAVTFGFGWAGKLGNVGYKGEGQAYIYEKDSSDCFNYSFQLEYGFGKGWYISGAVLHSTRGVSEPVNNWSKLSFQFTPQQLMPARWSFIASTKKQFTSTLSSNINLVFSPQVNMLIVYPSLKYKLRHNLDMDLVWQSYFLELQKRFQAESHRVFLRLKWGF